MSRSQPPFAEAFRYAQRSTPNRRAREPKRRTSATSWASRQSCSTTGAARTRRSRRSCTMPPRITAAEPGSTTSARRFGDRGRAHRRGLHRFVGHAEGAVGSSASRRTSSTRARLSAAQPARLGRGQGAQRLRHSPRPAQQRRDGVGSASRRRRMTCWRTTSRSVRAYREAGGGRWSTSSTASCAASSGDGVLIDRGPWCVVPGTVGRWDLRTTDYGTRLSGPAP